jgi:hypothetical protein
MRAVAAQDKKKAKARWGANENEGPFSKVRNGGKFTRHH